MLSRRFCMPPPNLFPFIAADPSVAVWRMGLACALVLSVAPLVALWRMGLSRSVLLPLLVGTAGCLALTVAAWLQSRDFIPVVCATSLRLDPGDQAVVERARAALHLNLIYQDLATAACVVTLALLVWGAVRLALATRRPRAA